MKPSSRSSKKISTIYEKVSSKMKNPWRTHRHPLKQSFTDVPTGGNETRQANFEPHAEVRNLQQGWAPILVALGICLVFTLILQNDFPRQITDSGWYLKMAAGQSNEVPSPFATRILHPALAKAAADIFDTDIESGFRITALCALFLFVSVTCKLLQHNGVPWLFILPLFLTPLPVTMLREGFLPDLYHAALLATFMSLVDRRFAASMAALLVLFLCRETTALVAITVAIGLKRQRRYRGVFVVIAISCASLATTWIAVTADHRNVHDIGSFAYLLFKFPFNLSRNLFGFELWVNTIDYCLPTRTWNLPNWASFGAIHTVGTCGFNFMRPLYLATYLTTSFGILPSIGGFLLNRFGKPQLTSLPVSLYIALTYGLVTLILTPAMGAATDRLVSYAWPLFYVGVPVLLYRFCSIRRQDLLVLASLHLAISWTPRLSMLLAGTSSALLIAGLLVAGACHFLGWRYISNLPRLIKKPRVS